MPQPTKPALFEQDEHAWKVGSGQDLDVGHSVFPRYAKDTADASQVEGIESFLLSGICGPRLTAVHECTDDTGIAHYHVGLHCQFGVGQHSWSAASKCCGCLLNPLIDLSVQGEVVSDGGAKICELSNDIELIVIDGDGWQFHCILSQDVGLIQTDDYSLKSLQAWEKRSISAYSSHWVMLHRRRTAYLWWGLCEPLSCLLGGQDWKACHLIWSADRFRLMLCQRHVSRAGQRRFQRALGLGRTLVWRSCGCQRAWMSCRWTALSLSCLCGRIRSCSAVLVGSQFLEGSGRGRLCWQDQTPLWGQWKWYTGVSVVLCTSGVGEGRRPRLLFTFQLGSHTGIRERHILPASAVGSRLPLQRLCQWRWEGRCLCSCCSRSSLPCSWRVWWSWRSSCLVVQLLASTDRVVHAENAVRRSCSAWLGLGGFHPCQRPSCRWPYWAPPKLALCLVLPWSAGIRQHQGVRVTQCSLWSRSRSSVPPISPTAVLNPW